MRAPLRTCAVCASYGLCLPVPAHGYAAHECLSFHSRVRALPVTPCSLLYQSPSDILVPPEILLLCALTLKSLGRVRSKILAESGFCTSFAGARKKDKDYQVLMILQVSSRVLHPLIVRRHLDSCNRVGAMVLLLARCASENSFPLMPIRWLIAS